jgi:hypothetical protein
MKNVVLAAIVALSIASSAVFAGGGGIGIAGGYQFTDLKAAKAVADSLDLPELSTNAIEIDIWKYFISSSFLRYTGMLSGAFNAGSKSKPSSTALDTTEAGVGFGDARLMFMPELYRNFGPINVGLGLGAGIGSTITFVKDSWSGNDALMNFYCFLRPQLAANYDIGPVILHATAGYYMPIAGSEGEYQFKKLPTADPTTIKFDPNEASGVFINFGFVFGKVTPE